ncbi:MAG: 2-hydroxyacyl-CoA dehydratase family protein [Planctomycetota bacterium]
MQEMLSFIAQLRQEALKKFKKNRVVGYFCVYVPPELIEAAGFMPVRLAGLGDGTAENEGEKFIHNEACSFCKECLGLKSLKQLPHNAVDRLIIPSGCDQMKRHGEKWNLDFNIPTYHLFVPATWEDPSSQNIYWQEIKWLADELDTLAQNNPDRKPINQVVAQYNEARKRFMRLSGLMDYADYFNLAHLFFISPVSDFLRYLDRIEQRLEPNPATSGKTRLLLVGSPVGYGDNFIQKALAKHPDAEIVYDATCTGHRSFDMDIPLSGDMIANIAASYFTRPPCIWRRPNTQFYQYIKGIIAKYRIDGIIYKTLKFCDLWKYEFKRFKDWAECPVIGIENTYSSSQDAQINKRISAFLETFKQ